MSDVAAISSASLDPDTRIAKTNMGSRIKSIVGGSIGNLVEWYDWYVYAAFSLYFAKTFFPNGDETAQLLNTAGVFALGFVVRPIGGWIMGIYADRRGRKAALTLSVLAMCFGSLIVAFTPGYATIGVYAPVLLVSARLLQGLSIGGEYGCSATYLSEMATADRRGFYSSFQYVTLIGGQLIALTVLILLQQVFLTEAQISDWGWRIPFIIGALCAVVAVYLRRNIEETSAFKAKKTEQPPVNLLAELLRHPRAVLTVVGLTMGGYPRLLYLHDIHAEVPRQYGQDDQGRREPYLYRRLVLLHALATDCRSVIRPYRPPAYPDRIRCAGNSLHCSDPHCTQSDD